MNRYSYVIGNPLTRIDPSGEQCKGTWFRFKWISYPPVIPILSGPQPSNKFNVMPSLICKCFWYCQDCRNTPNLIGDGDGLPSTFGVTFFSGDGNPQSGTECLCRKPSEEKPCRECEAY